MFWLLIAAAISVGVLFWNLSRRFSARRLRDFNESRRGASRIVSLGEFVDGNQKVRANFAELFQGIPDVRAELLRTVSDDDSVWIERRLHGTRRDGTPMEFAGVNIFGVRDDRFVWGRIYTELVRDTGGITVQIERMTRA